MKIFIPADGEDISNNIDSHFSKAKCFIFFDTDKDTWEIFQNPEHVKHPGLAIAKIAIGLKVHAVIVQNIGPNSFRALSQDGIKVYISDDISVKEAVYLLKKDSLKQLDKATKKRGKILGED